MRESLNSGKIKGKVVCVESVNSGKIEESRQGADWLELFFTGSIRGSRNKVDSLSS